MHTTLENASSQTSPTITPAQALDLFHRSLALANLHAPQGTYQRLWTALITLWYLIWQWLQPNPDPRLIFGKREKSESGREISVDEEI